MAYYTNRFEIEISHPGLNKFRIVKGSTRWEAQQKASAQMAQWDEQWRKKQAQLKKQKDRANKLKADESAIRYAASMTDEANEVQAQLDRILTDSVGNYGFNFKKMKDNSKFNNPKPVPPVHDQIPDEPKREEAIYNEKPTLLMRLSKNKMAALEKANNDKFDEDHTNWEQQANKIKDNNEKKDSDYKTSCDSWEKAKNAFYAEQSQKNAAVDDFEEKVNNGDKTAIETLFSLLISEFSYPLDYSIDVDVQFFPDEKQLIIEMFLPVQEDIPNKKAVTYVKSRQEFKESFYPDSYIKKKYDNVIYQIVMQTLDQCFHIGNPDIDIKSIVYNGRVQSIDKATGNEIQPCILSVAVKKEDFENVNLSTVDPKAWFKSAKGVSAATLVNLTPIAPIVEMNKEDKRFIDAYEVADNLSDGENIATMPWQDFENLIREIFEKEFNSTGGEVKITQASRDGGVDAVAFDPDPIRGGKIVIQAKRYTNVVGVSAVRDLYGTVMNEGAIKGILVTTSHYGSDAYEFAKDKPITLMNGANLLYLLEKHGYNARIDIKEAKKVNSDQ